MSLRLRLLLALAPLAVLLAVLGVAGAVQLQRTAGRIDAILRENYVSVQAMFRLTEATERIDSSFQFVLAGREDDADRQFDIHWAAFDAQFQTEVENVTIHPAEDELVARLRALKDDYRRRGVAFFAAKTAAARSAAYFGRAGDPGLLGRFNDIKAVSAEILRINRENMEAARDGARATARSALIGLGVSLAVVSALVAGAGWYLLRTILAPIRAVTAAARAIGLSRELDREVPVFGRDELGQLAEAFNAMTRQLREYRQSNLAKLVRAQRTAQATIDSFPDPVLVLEPAGRVELVNPAARQILGAAPAADGQAGVEWQPPDALRQPVRDALRTQQAFTAERFDQALTFRLGADDRSYLPQVRPIRDPGGDTLGAAVVLNDVTRFRLLDQMKSDLVATVSHELKTPLTSVRLAVHVLLEETIGPLTPKQAELLIDARDNAERLLDLIDQLLALARLQRPDGEDPRRPEDPGDLLRRAADAVRGRAADKHVDVTVEADEPLPPVAADPDRIGQALGNLLNNAVTYTPSGGRITLSAAPAPGGRIELAVADTGVGIPAAYLPYVFERFFRVPGQSDPTGTGLGLAIVKEIATAHGGDVTCASEPGRGTTFRVTLPAWAAGEGDRRDH
ncbi:MAG TPA: ATP-binding protein [Urbifossiella sp.]|jgi:signal transduction histidine kinase|nr:ATP-binding protein [Urbifossiella sp.]